MNWQSSGSETISRATVDDNNIIYPHEKVEGIAIHLVLTFFLFRVMYDIDTYKKLVKSGVNYELIS